MGMMMNLRRSQMMVTEKDYIPFVDPVVAQICADNWGDGKGITYKQAAAVTDIGTWFKGNTEITSFDEFEKFKGITQLGPINWNNRYAFYKCSALESIRLPETLKIIGTQSFDQCTSLKEVNLPIGIEQVCADAFRDTQVSGDVYLPNLINIRQGAFAQSSFTSVSSLGSTITELEDGGYDTGISGSYRGVFAKSLNLERVVLPSSLEKIGRGSFGGCTALNSLSVNWNNIQTIGNVALYGCTSLEIDDLALPNLTSLGQNAFYGVKIKKISDLGKITALPSASSSTQNFGDKSVLEEVVLPAAITDIPQYSFYNYVALKKCNLENIVSVGTDAFRYCPLEGVLSIPNLATISVGSFNTTRFSEILDLGNLATITGSNTGNHLRGAFGDNPNLTKVIIPPTVIEIGAGAFAQCTLLKEFICKAETVPSLGNRVFYNTPIETRTGKIYVPDASVDAYKAATNWATYASLIKPLSEYNG